jgi:hypothetical protein
MSTLELKSCSRDSPLERKESKSKIKESKVSSSRSDLSTGVSDPSLLTQTNRVTSDLAFDLESLRHKMDSILSRASHVASQEEDEDDAKMRQLLEEIYAAPSLTREEEERLEDWETETRYLNEDRGEEWTEGGQDCVDWKEQDREEDPHHDLSRSSMSEMKEPQRRATEWSERKGVF